MTSQGAGLARKLRANADLGRHVPKISKQPPPRAAQPAPADAIPYLARPLVNVKEVLAAADLREKAHSGGRTPSSASNGTIPAEKSDRRGRNALSLLRPARNDGTSLPRFSQPSFCSNTATRNADKFFRMPVKAHPVIVAETMYSLRNDGLPQVCFLGPTATGSSKSVSRISTSLVNGYFCYTSDLVFAPSFPAPSLFPSPPPFSITQKVDILDTFCYTAEVMD